MSKLPLPPIAQDYRENAQDMFRRIAPGRLRAFEILKEKVGDVAMFTVFGRKFVLLSHPDYIRHVLVENERNYMKSRALRATQRVTGNGLLTSEDDFHLRQRRLVAPAFHRQRIEQLAEMMTAFAREQISHWQDGQTIDLHAQMMHLTLTIAAKALFDADLRASQKVGVDSAHQFEHSLNFLLENFRPIDGTWIGKLLSTLPTRVNLQRESHAKMLDKIVFGFIQERRASGEDKGDLLSMLLQAQDEEGGSGGMTDQQVRDEAMTLFIAGHETTAVALAWAGYLLAEHPAVQDELRQQVLATIGTRPVTLADLPKLDLARQIIAETLRLYPPAYVLPREAIADDAIGGYRIPKGTTVFVSQWVMHRDARWWQSPTEFRPARFANSEPQPNRFVYFPFGRGVRQCIGEQFAWMEAQLLLISFVQKFSWQLQAGFSPTLRPQITLRPAEGMWLTLQGE